MMKNFLKTRPRLYDWYIRMKRLRGRKRSSFDFFDTFSKESGHPVSFVQIGANDGLRNDPIREFIVRDRWTGILIEPLPTAFIELKRNYHYLKNPYLFFVNAAISNEGGHLSFWTFKEAFLAGLPLEKKMSYLRKSSFDPDHLRRFVPDDRLFEDIAESIQVPCLSIADVVKNHGLENKIDLLVVDAEGFESVIIPSIDFSVIKPKAIYFEFEHLGSEKVKVYQYLISNGYEMKEIKTEAVAILNSLTKK